MNEGVSLFLGETQEYQEGKSFLVFLSSAPLYLNGGKMSSLLALSVGEHPCAFPKG